MSALAHQAGAASEQSASDLPKMRDGALSLPVVIVALMAMNAFRFAFGLTFELPLVVTGLVVMGIVTPDALRTHRASILMGLWTASCFITPGADPYSPLILGVAFTLLFFVSMGLIRFVRPGSAADPIQIASPGVELGRTDEVECLR